MKNKKNMKAENYNSELLDSMLDAISPEEQLSIDRKMMLAAKIYDAMKAKGWTQTIFAREMGKHPSEISKWLSGTHTFTSDTLWAIGDKLGVDLLPVKAVQKIVDVKFVPIVISAPPAEYESEKLHGIFSDLLFTDYISESVWNKYSTQINLNSKNYSLIQHADC